MNAQTQKPLNVEQAANFLGLSVSHLYKLTSQGKIKHYKPGGKRLYFFPSDLIGYLKSGSVPTNREIETEAANRVVNG